MTLTPQQRSYAYRAGLAVIGLLTVYGILAEEYAAAWAVALAPLLGLADANVPR